MLVADCEPSYRLLLPLSSTCRHFYELIHEESVSGVSQGTVSEEAAAARVSCWRHHPVLRVAISRLQLLVDSFKFVLMERDALFVSHVLTSLRHVRHLLLFYSCHSGPHAANLHPLRCFTRLCSLVLVVPHPIRPRHAAKQANVAANLSSALLSLGLSSLIDLTVYDLNSDCMVVEAATLQRLAKQRLMHVTLNQWHYHQLTTPTPEQLLGGRWRFNHQPTTYPNILSVSAAGTPQKRAPTPREFRHTFPNAKHIALGTHACLNLDNMVGAGDQQLLDLDSLHVRVEHVMLSFVPPQTSVGCRLRCLILSCSGKCSVSWLHARVSYMLSLMPHLEQLAIVYHSHIRNSYDDEADWSTVPSIFDSRNLQPLPKLTYLQFTAGLCKQDLDYLLSSTSPPAFAATLTHLELKVRWPDRQRVTALLPSLLALYPSLQRCRIGLQVTAANLREKADEVAAWRAAWDCVRLQVQAISEEAVRVDRLDVRWRREAGMAPVWDSLLGNMVNVSALGARQAHQC